MDPVAESSCSLNGEVKRYIPNKFFRLLVDFINTISYKLEVFVYKDMISRLSYLYENGNFKEARELINSIETNSVTVKFPVKLRMKEYQWNNK
jgi:hypothetical protein